MLRIAIAGAGYMGRSRAKAFANIDGVQVVGDFARSPGNAAYTDYAAMLDAADAVAICLPNAIHSQYALQALQAGKHVLVEYPLCTSAVQIDPLMQAAQSGGVVLMVGNTIVHEPMYQYVQAARPHLGRVFSAASRVAAYDPALAGTWFMNPNVTGPVFAALHYHHIEYYRHFVGEVAHVTATQQSDRKTVIGGVMTMTHNNRAVSTIHWHLVAAAKPDAHVPRCMWLNGMDDSLAIVEKDGKSHAIWGHGGDGRVDVFDNGDWGVADSTRQFIDAIRGEFDHASRLESDIATLQVGLRAAQGEET